MGRGDSKEGRGGGGVFNGPIRRVPELADLKTLLNCLLNNGKEDTVLCIFNHD